MGSLGSFLFVYFLGGLTFIPLVLSLVFLFIYLTLQDPTSPPSSTTRQQCDNKHAHDPLRRPTDDRDSLKSGTDALAEEFHRIHESDVAAGYFAVCREYVPGGVNGKPPERTTPAGEVIAAESPSVYQSMYRSLFDRKQAPSIEPTKANGKAGKRARNVFFIVLRHGHLMLYDDANQIEVRYVISLAHHDVSICGGECRQDEIPEGELWLKRNAICLSRRLESLGDLGGPTPPFFLFSENLSEKEDFYFALLQNQARMGDPANSPPKYQNFDVKHIVTLVQRLHSSEEQLQTRWINAVLGRLFLALYKTPEMEEFIRGKITKKISRVNKPNFISRIGLRHIDMGEGAPFITNPRLKDLTVDGNCCVETDIQYAGNFRVEISAAVRIDLGPRFKAREVDIILAVVLKKLEGHMLLRFKRPPSNRVWMSFETMPNMDMHIEPIVSSKQITLGIVLRTIESRIREVVAESIVLPFWDDIPFLDTFSQPFRGGIWQREIPEQDLDADIPDESQKPQGNKEETLNVLRSKDDRTMSMPVLSEPATAALKPRKSPKSSISGLPSEMSALSSSVEKPPLPRAMRSQTFSDAADPVVTPDNVKVDKVSRDNKNEDKSSATSVMIEISNRSPPSSPGKSPGSSPTTDGASPDYLSPRRKPSTVESVENIGELQNESRPRSAHAPHESSLNMRSVANRSTTSIGSTKSRRRGTFESFTKSIASSVNSDDDKSQSTLSLGTATAAAKKWGMNMFGRGEQNAGQDASRPAGTPREPMGRGHPLPPPGTPLPRPEEYALKLNSTSTKRKPVPGTTLPERSNEGNKGPVPKPPLPPRKTKTSSDESVARTDELLVIEAPPDSPVVDVPPAKGSTDQSTDQIIEQSIEQDVSAPTDDGQNTRDPSDSSQDQQDHRDASHRTETVPQPPTPTKHGMEILSATDGFFP